MGAQLIISEPSGRKRTFPLSGEGETSIGRGTDNEIVLADPEASRHHCTIRRDRAGARIEDNGSRNGTYVNSKLVKSSEHLKDGDTVTIGQCTIRLVTLGRGAGVGGALIPRRFTAACIFAVIFAVAAAAGLLSDQLARFFAGAPAPDPQVDEGLVVRSAPPGAMVFVNSQYAGVTPLELTPENGIYSVRLVLSGYEPHSQAVEISGLRREIDVRLVPIEPGFIQIASEPSDAEVFVDGGKVGRSPIAVTTAPGTHEIVIQKTNYITWKGTVEVEPGQPVRVAGAMEQRQIANYLSLLQDDPNNVSYYSQLGHLYILEERWAEAYDALRKAMETYCRGKDTSGYAGRMKWLFDKIYFGDYFHVAEKEKHEEIREWIIALYAEMIKKYPAQKGNLTQWLTGILKRSGRANQVPQLLAEAAPAPDLRIYFQAADIYLDKGVYSRAVGILNKAVNLGPKSFQARYKLGRAYLLWCKAGKREFKDDAVSSLKKALELCKDENERNKIETALQEAARL